MAIARDKPDPRDIIFQPPPMDGALPAAHDLRPEDWRTNPLWKTWNQGKLESCTAMALAAYHWYLQHKDRLPTPFEPSRNYVWYYEKALEREQGNEPASLRDGMKILRRMGACTEEMWPSTSATMDAAGVDMEACRAFGRQHCSTAYHAVPIKVAAAKACLLTGHPVAFGAELFFSALDTTTTRTGDIPIPGSPESADPYRTNHAMLFVGYDDSRPVYEGISHTPAGHGAFILRNSYGTYWGSEQDGYGTLPYAYLTDPRDLCHSFWMVKAVQ